jgi:polysaccharide deacetylase family protein (PEP-CTERM system associated)
LAQIAFPFIVGGITATNADVISVAETNSCAFSPRFEDAPCAAPRDPNLPWNAFTVDVEDWYQSCLDYDAPITDRVVRNVHRILAVLDDCGVKGSFFIQGRVAETFPKLVSSLVEDGHEVQSHGYSHRPLFAMSKAELRNELERAKKTVEDAAGTPVKAFRAQDFSILAQNLWALETLVEVGFEIDSSIFAMRSRHYGIARWRLHPHYIFVAEGVRILEVPVAIWSFGTLRLPVAGGGYFRLLPRGVIDRGLRSIAAAGRPAVVYCHPYEFNSDELGEYRDVPRRLRLSQGIGRRRFPERVRALLSSFAFGRLSDVLSAWGLA